MTHQAVIMWRTRDGKTFRWLCLHAHHTERAAFACGSAEVRREFATARPRTHIEAFNLMTRTREAGAS